MNRHGVYEEQMMIGVQKKVCTFVTLGRCAGALLQSVDHVQGTCQSLGMVDTLERVADVEAGKETVRLGF